MITLLSLASSLVLAHENKPESPQAAASWAARSGWTTQYIERFFYPTVDVGSYNSIAFNPHDNLPYISYYHATNKDLMLASPASSLNGNCGPSSNDWWCRPVDGDGLEGRSTDDTGQYSSLAFWKGSGDDTWKLGISYYDATIYGLRYAEWNCEPGSCGWIYTTLHTGSEYYYVGLYTSLHYDSTGYPHIAYYGLNTQGADDLWYANYVSNGTGSCPGSNYWMCQRIDTGDGTGKFASLDLTYNGRVDIAYYSEATGDLKYAYYTGLGNCISGNGWVCRTIDSVGNVGGYTSIVAPGYINDVTRVAYYDFLNRELRYAYSGMSGGSGNCGPSNSWQCNMVDDMSSDPPVGISMKEDPEGYPMIAYQYVDHSDPSSYHHLRIARPYLVYHDSDIGNCGDTPPGYAVLYWRCTSLDQGYYYDHEASFVSLAISPSGLGAISYTEDNDNYQSTVLRLAYQKYLNLYLPVINK